MIRELQVDDRKAWADIKSIEISKLDLTGEFTGGGVKVEIKSVSKFDGGIEVCARAWKDGKSLGLGDGGKFETERFLIHNHPILVPDDAGDVIRESIDEETGLPVIKRFREDPIEAVKQVLTDIISVTGKDRRNIVKGSVGNTTSTFNPAAGAVSPCDGTMRRQTVDETFSTIRTSAGTS